MGAIERIGRRIIESVEDRTGREVVPRDELQIMESARSDNRVLRKTLDFIGWTLMNHQGAPQIGRMPTDVPIIARIAMAAQAQRAWQDDPMAGQQVDLYLSFVFGRGVPRPQAHDDEVQDHLDKAWDDEANKRVLTSFEKLVEKGVDLSIQSNVFWLFFSEGLDGMVRTSLLTFEDVIDVVRHPKDKYRILFYKVLERTVQYDYRNGRYVSPPGEAGKAKTVYYEALGAFDPDNPVMVAQDEMAGGEEALRPPANMVRPGKVVHLAVNKNSEMAFGVPRMRRLLQWFRAYNEVLESHVNRMKAMASIYMKSTAKGANDRELERLGQMALGGRRSVFGESTDVVEHSPATRGPAGPMTPGVIAQNESMNYEPFKIDSGASDVAASIPQLRAQVSGIFPPTYYGQDAGSLAGQMTVELPVLKFIEREQEFWLRPFRTLGEEQIQAAVDAGDLSEWREPTQEELDRIEMWQENGTPLDGLEFDPQTGQVKRDLGFEISLPSPLKRMMGDLVAAAVQTATAIDPMGANPEVSRWLFAFILADGFDVEDPMRIVDQVLPRHVAAALAAGQQIDPATGRPIPPEDAGTVTGPDGQQHPADNPHGAQVNSPQPEDRKVQEAVRERGRRRAALHASSARRRSVEEAFKDDVVAVAREHLQELDSLPTQED